MFFRGFIIFSGRSILHASAAVPMQNSRSRAGLGAGGTNEGKCDAESCLICFLKGSVSLILTNQLNKRQNKQILKSRLDTAGLHPEPNPI
jgi:hypothetical protein